MTNIEQRVDAIARFVLAESTEARNRARVTLRELIDGQPVNATDSESIVREIFLELGAPDHLIGHYLAVDAVLLAAEDRTYVDNIVSGLYPYLAQKHRTTAARVERAIRHLIEVTWTRGDPETLYRHFGNTVSPDKGKPTNGEFIARIANIVKLRMRGGA